MPEPGADGPIFSLRRADQSHHEIGEFRAWAGYRNLGSDEATDDLAHFQHVLSFAGTDTAGRTGVHAHLAQAHIVIPTSGRGVFSYDGVVVEAVPGVVIVQHGGTVHDQFEYSYAPASQEENGRTPLAVEGGANARSFSFLELFVPKLFANVEVIPPGAVTAADQNTAWAHPYHAPGARFSLQAEDAPGAAYRPLAGQPGLEARDADTWDASGGMVATWIIRPSRHPSAGPAISLGIPGETDGIEILYMVDGEAGFCHGDGGEGRLGVGDTLTVGQGLVGELFDWSPDMWLLRFFIAAKARLRPVQSPEEIKRLEALGPGIITGREVRPAGDTRPVNFLQQRIP